MGVIALLIGNDLATHVRAVHCANFVLGYRVGYHHISGFRYLHSHVAQCFAMVACLAYHFDRCSTDTRAHKPVQNGIGL